MKNKSYNMQYVAVITLVATLGGLLFGYDTAVISGAEKGLEGFFMMAQDFTYTKTLHGMTSSSALIGCVIGGLLSGIFATRLGRRNSLRLAAVLFFVSALGSYCPEFLFFAKNEPSLELLYAFNAYRILGGIGVGLASAVTPMYIAEIAPSHIRGTLVSCNQFAIIFGMLVTYFVNYLILGSHTYPVIDHNLISGLPEVNPSSDMWTINTGWRYMFGSEAFVALAFGMLLFAVPRTPRYLVMSGNELEAMRVLRKINGSANASQIFEDIKQTAKEKTERLFSYGTMVVVIGILLSVFQQAIGINAVLYYAPRIFENAWGGSGMMQTVVMGIVNIVFTVAAIIAVDKIGRRLPLMAGSAGMAAGAFAVALCDYFGIHGIAPVLAIILYAAFFMFSWGPICWVLISEIFPNTIRSKAVAVAVAAQWVFNYLVSSTFPPLYDYSPVIAYGLYGIMCLLSFVFVLKFVPETKGKTLEQMSSFWRR